MCLRFPVAAIYTETEERKVELWPALQYSHCNNAGHHALRHQALVFILECRGKGLLDSVVHRFQKYQLCLQVALGKLMVPSTSVSLTLDR